MCRIWDRLWRSQNSSPRPRPPTGPPARWPPWTRSGAEAALALLGVDGSGVGLTPAVAARVARRAAREPRFAALADALAAAPAPQTDVDVQLEV